VDIRNAIVFFIRQSLKSYTSFFCPAQYTLMIVDYTNSPFEMFFPEGIECLFADVFSPFGSVKEKLFVKENPRMPSPLHLEYNDISGTGLFEADPWFHLPLFFRRSRQLNAVTIVDITDKPATIEAVDIAAAVLVWTSRQALGQCGNLSPQVPHLVRFAANRAKPQSGYHQNQNRPLCLPGYIRHHQELYLKGQKIATHIKKLTFLLGGPGFG